MDSVLSFLAVVVGLLVIAWLFGPDAQRGRPARQERDQTSGNDAHVGAQGRKLERP